MMKNEIPIPSVLIYWDSKSEQIYLVECGAIYVDQVPCGAPCKEPEKFQIQEFIDSAFGLVLSALDRFLINQIEDETKIPERVNIEQQVLERKCLEIMVSRRLGDNVLRIDIPERYVELEYTSLSAKIFSKSFSEIIGI